ncbi:MAG: 16S rRNA (guanine(527)-N(7))-methyltransferase RsmG [Rhodobacteraceae bacterium]|nr:16S rRNA (guanine(527)-N(7))-methyltransferase RsmG [Paracoccaceae bacterium]
MKHSQSSNQPPYGPQDLARDLNVSRETLQRLEAFAALLVQWNAKINLVAKSTISDLWRRHILDSGQLAPLLPVASGPVVDLGSGAGFPGLILAILGIKEVHLVESDARKAAFLREAARHTQTDVLIHVSRIEAVKPFAARAVTARALAPLTELLDLAFPFFGPNTVGLFLKGQNVGAELTEAHKTWKIRVDQLSSHSDPTASVVCVREVKRVEPV